MTAISAIAGGEGAEKYGGEEWFTQSKGGATPVLGLSRAAQDAILKVRASL